MTCLTDAVEAVGVSGPSKHQQAPRRQCHRLRQLRWPLCAGIHATAPQRWQLTPVQMLLTLYKQVLLLYCVGSHGKQH